jgi:hypothetical protein
MNAALSEDKEIVNKVIEKLRNYSHGEYTLNK